MLKMASYKCKHHVSWDTFSKTCKDTFSFSFVQPLVIVFHCNSKYKTKLKTHTGMDFLES